MGGGGPQVDVDCVGVGGPLGVETLVGAETLRVKINISLPPPSPLTLAWLNSCSLTSVSDSLQSQVGVSLQLVVSKYSQQFLRAAEFLCELLALEDEEEGGGGVEGEQAGLCPLLADCSPRGDHLPGRARQPGREVTALLQPHSLLQDQLPHPVVRSQSQAQPVTPGAEPLQTEVSEV